MHDHWPDRIYVVAASDSGGDSRHLHFRRQSTILGGCNPDQSEAGETESDHSSVEYDAGIMVTVCTGEYMGLGLYAVFTTFLKLLARASRSRHCTVHTLLASMF